jgi:hypothetical protein
MPEISPKVITIFVKKDLLRTVVGEAVENTIARKEDVDRHSFG